MTDDTSRIPSPSSPPAPDDLRALSARLAELSAKATRGEWKADFIDGGETPCIYRDLPALEGAEILFEADWASPEDTQLAAALVNALRAGHLHAGPAGDEGWRDISTAPRDRPILLLTRGRRTIDRVQWTAPERTPGYWKDLNTGYPISMVIEAYDKWADIPPLPEPPSAQRRPPQPSAGGES